MINTTLKKKQYDLIFRMPACVCNNWALCSYLEVWRTRVSGINHHILELIEPECCQRIYCASSMYLILNKFLCCWWYRCESLTDALMQLIRRARFKLFLTAVHLRHPRLQSATPRTTCSSCGRREIRCKWTPSLCRSLTSDRRTSTTGTAPNSTQAQVGLFSKSRDLAVRCQASGLNLVFNSWK